MVSVSRLLKLEKDANKAIPVIINIITNIILYPNEKKYCTLRYNNKTFNENVVQVKYAIDFLIELGFRKKIDNMEEILFIENVNVVKLCILKDVLNELKEISLPPSPVHSNCTSYQEIKIMQAEKQKYIDFLIKQAEEDRLDKLEKEKKNNAKLKQQQDLERHLNQIKAKQLRESIQERKFGN